MKLAMNTFNWSIFEHKTIHDSHSNTCISDVITIVFAFVLMMGSEFKLHLYWRNNVITKIYNGHLLEVWLQINKNLCNRWIFLNKFDSVAYTDKPFCNKMHFISAVSVRSLLTTYKITRER